MARRGISHRLQLPADVMIMVDGGLQVFQRLWACGGDHIADPAAALVLQRAAQALVVVVGQACGTHMGRDIALIVGQGSPQALAIDQQLVVLTRQRALYIVTQVITVRLTTKHACVEFLLKLPGQR